MKKIGYEDFSIAAEKAIRLGWDNGHYRSTPHDSYSVAQLCGLPVERANLHRKKLRQIYGAAFDVARAHKANS